MKNQFDDIYFTNEEKRIIRALKKNQRINSSVFDFTILNNLIIMGFVSYNHLTERGPAGAFIPDGTVSLTDHYKRYRKFKIKTFIDHRIPIIISVIALLKSFEVEITSIVKQLMQLLK